MSSRSGEAGSRLLALSAYLLNVMTRAAALSVAGSHRDALFPSPPLSLSLSVCVCRKNQVYGVVVGAWSNHG